MLSRTGGRAHTQVDVEFLLPRLQGICEFMLAAQQDPDVEVRMSPIAVDVVARFVKETKQMGYR